MRRVGLRGTDIETSALGFGCSGLMGSGSKQERQALLGSAFDLGITHFDVARLYGLGMAEGELGEFIRTRRDRVTVTTKFGLEPVPVAVGAAVRILNRLGARGIARRIDARSKRGRSHRFEVGEARSALESSLKKLKTDTIDIYLLHDCDVRDVSSPNLIEFLEGAKTEGKIRAYGVGTSLDAIVEIDRVAPVLTQVVQFSNRVDSRNIDRLPSAGSRAIFTHGALAGAQPLHREWVKANSAEVGRASEELGIDMRDPAVWADALLAYARWSNPDGVVLFSTTSGKRIENNVRAFESPILDRPGSERFVQVVAEGAR